MSKVTPINRSFFAAKIALCAIGLLVMDRLLGGYLGVSPTFMFCALFAETVMLILTICILVTQYLFSGATVLANVMGTLLSTCAWYAFVFVNLLVPQLILLGYLGYHSKPSEDSLQQSIHAFLKFSTAPRTENPTCAERVMGWFIGHYVRYEMRSKITPFFYDLGVARIACLDMGNSENLFMFGVFGTWLPLWTARTAK